MLQGSTTASITAGIALAVFLMVSFFPVKPEIAPNKQPVLSEQRNFIKPAFIDKTIELGFIHEHRQRDEKISGLDQISGAGACVLDFDSDGWLDILFLGGSGIGHYFGKPKWWQTNAGNILYRNLNGTGFQPVPEAIPDALNWGINCTAADFDSDGDPDLFIANKGPNQFWENANGVFRPKNIQMLKADSRWTHGVTAADFDGDNLVDLYLANYVDYAPDRKYFEESFGYGGSEEALFQAHLFEPQGNQLLKNLGNWQFDDVTQESGTGDSSGRSVKVHASDINDDNLIDILIANDAESPSRLFINQGSMRFEEHSSKYGVAGSHAHRDITFQVLNSEDRQILIGGSADLPLSLLNYSEQSGIYEKGHWGDLRSHTESNQAIGLVDLNQDGYLDIYLANGLLSPDMDSPGHAQAQKNRLLLGTQDSTFIDCVSCLPESIPLSNRQILIEDFDRDGDLDIFETANNDLPRYLENQLISEPRGAATSELKITSEKFRLQLTDWLIEDGLYEIAIDELALLTQSESEEITTQALLRLGKIKHPNTLAPITRSLRDRRLAVQTQAIKALEIQEVDFSGRYMIPKLNHVDESVVCATADAFSHFFDEEEAMIRSKHLAVSVLVERVEKDTQANIPLCLIRALGKTESYRALTPLLKLTASENPDIAESAVNALGHINEKMALARLQEIAQNNSQSDRLRQAALNSISLISGSSNNSFRASPLAYEQGQSEHKFNQQESKNQGLCESAKGHVFNYDQADPEGRRQIRNILLSTSEETDKRLAILGYFADQPLLSEYRAAIQIYNNRMDPVRFCAASVLMAYDSKNHEDELMQALISDLTSEQGKMQLAQSLRNSKPKIIWKALLDNTQ